MSWQIVPLDRSHQRDAFDCGEPSLNDYLCRYARQNDAKGVSRTFVLLEEGSPIILGYYTLSAGSVAFTTLPDDYSRLPKYPVPTAHIGRLAVDRTRQGQRLGELLLVDALKRIRQTSRQIGIHAVTVHALHEKAKAFYEKFGFIPLKDDALHLFLPLATIENL
jgi:ribosomal protein S18 acetylase RimI-like enzyme